MSNNSSTAELRQAILDSVPSDTSTHGGIPEPRHVYVPASHVKALRLDSNLVIGARGVGKSFWSAALTSVEIRATLEDTVSDLASLDVAVGFSERDDLDAYPNLDTFTQLQGQGNEPYHVWKAVLARWLAKHVGENIPKLNWQESVAWVRDEPESYGRLLGRADAAFAEKDRKGLIVFDALDRSSRSWKAMDQITRDLLQVVLSLKPYRHLHCKVFLREDQFAGRRVTDFPDASKLLALRVDLTWELHDLHGLLWQHLVNGPHLHGKSLRDHFESVCGDRLITAGDALWRLPERVRRDSDVQKRLFASLAGESMGRDRRRGIPYTWVVGHLADGRGRTSPRSFLAAIRNAAEDSQGRSSEHPSALHYESLKRGVQKASEIRVKELAEDYPWITELLEPLRGLTVPCEFSAVEARWSSRPTFAEGDHLPPEHEEEGAAGIRQDLEKLGVFQAMKDGRINMPDLYRVGFGLGRRGGVKPAKQTNAD